MYASLSATARPAPQPKSASALGGGPAGPPHLVIQTLTKFLSEKQDFKGLYAERYRTSPLRGLWQHPPYFHDSSAPDLMAVVNHYDRALSLNLTAAQKSDLVEYLKSL